uniref:Uncharacterized protein n=1 Tax=viral metagenome TaxID=1070528 RepID=A0A6C0M0Y7_9ZZZZ
MQCNVMQMWIHYIVKKMSRGEGKVRTQRRGAGPKALLRCAALLRSSPARRFYEEEGKVRTQRRGAGNYVPRLK